MSKYYYPISIWSYGKACEVLGNPIIKRALKKVSAGVKAILNTCILSQKPFRQDTVYIGENEGTAKEKEID